MMSKLKDQKSCIRKIIKLGGKKRCILCAKCNILACGSQDPVVREKMPKNCPMREQEKMNNAFEKYALEENHEFYVKCSEIEGEGYCQWPRLKETVEFCKKWVIKR